MSGELSFEAKNLALILSIYSHFGAAPMQLVKQSKQAEIRNIDGSLNLKLSSDEVAALHGAIEMGWVLQKQNWLAISPKGKMHILRCAKNSHHSYANQHRILAKTNEQRTINLKESPLGWLASRRGTDGTAFLSTIELNAGEKLRNDFEIAGLQPRTTMSWQERSPSATKGNKAGAAFELADFRLDAKRRFNDALQALEPQQRGLLVDVCCLLKGLELAEKERGWPRRSAKIVLKCALAQLAQHYKIAPKDWLEPRHWGAEDFRPTL